MISGKVRNKDRLFQKLRALAPAVAEEVGRGAVELGNEMVSTARSYVAVAQGDLRDSIVATPGGQPSPAFSQPGGSQVVPDHAVLVTAGDSKVRYPHLVEYGTRPHVNAGVFKGTQNPGAPAQPYFWPSFRLIRKRLRGRLTRAVNNAIKQVAR